MKKMKLISLGTLVFGIASFMAYPNGLIASETSNNSEVSNETRIVEGNLFKNLKLTGLKILVDFSVPITEKEGVKEILSKQGSKLYGAFNRDGVPSISYYIVHEGDKVSFKNFNVRKDSVDEKQEKPPVSYWNCPDGLDYVKTCYDENCVMETLRELGEDFSDGELIYIHNDGMFGIIICSNVR